MNRSLYQKHRPKNFGGIVGQEKIVKTLKNALKADKLGHAYLFAGQRGTGKTTIARLLAKAANCQEISSGKSKTAEPCQECTFCLSADNNQAIDIIEIDAASNRGIDEIRDLREKIKFAPLSGRFKVYIIDEVHMLTKEAFNAILKTLEEPPAHVIFILATTEAHKLPATILSRVQRFDFQRLPINDIVSNLKNISQIEKIDIDDPALNLIASKADGSHRDAISLLEQIKAYSTKISVKEVEEVLGLAGRGQSLELLAKIATGDLSGSLTQIEQDYNLGLDLSQLIINLEEDLRRLIIFQSGAEGIVSLIPEEEAIFRRLTKIASGNLIAAAGVVIKAAKETKTTEIPTLPLALAVSEMVKLWSEPKIDDKKEKIEDIQAVKSVDTSDKNQPTPKVEIGDQKIDQVEKEKATEAKISKSTVDLDHETWLKILNRIKAENHSLNALLRDIKPRGISDGRLTLCAKFKFHSDKISEIKNRQIIERMIEEVSGRKLTIFCQLEDQILAKESSGGDDLLAAAEEVFK